MAKKMLIDATHPEETRVVVLDGNRVEDFDFESVNKRQLAGNIYLAKVTRVEPSLQAAFVDYGGNRHGFLAFAEIHPDYYQIPVADREALLAEEEQAARDEAAEEDEGNGRNRRRERRPRSEDRGSRGDDRNSPRADPEAAAEGGAEAPAEAERGAEGAPAEGGGSGRRRRRGSGRKTAGVGGLDVIDLDAGASRAEEPGDGVPRGLEIADLGGQDPAPAMAATPPAANPETPEPAEAAEEARDPQAAPDADTAADGAASGTGEDPADDAPEDTGGTPRSMAESTGLEDETLAADLPEDTGNGDSDSASRSGRGGRRTRKSRGSSARADDDAQSDAPPESTEIESAGADDPREELLARERSIRRRRYKIQDVIKVRQILLVQVVKEERGNKGAALTTYLSLAGRYCVLMPNTARGGGISRKIVSAADRKRLREIVDELDVPRGMGLIVRTAGAERTRPEIKRDYEFLSRQWEQVRDLTLKSIAPCLIYEEGSLIKRTIRDMYSKDIDSIQVEGEAGYREAKDYMKMLMPSHAKNVQQYSDPVPLFIRNQVESYLNGMFSPVVQLRSGGYIVIGITEALVAIDVNSGRSTKEGSIEDTALKTNLEAADEVARQLRLRDLAGLIVIDFIDMDEGRNNRAVEKRIKERLKTDRARIQIGRISAFGLMEMSRQRLRPGMLEASTQPCPHCHATGMIRSDDSLALAILREVEEEGIRSRLSEVTVIAPVGIANYLINHKRAHILRIEERHGLTVRIFGDPLLVSPDYKIERVKSLARETAATQPDVITAESAVGRRPLPPAVETEPEDEVEEVEDSGVGDSGAGVQAAAPASPAPTAAERAEGEAAKRRRRGKRGGRRRRNREDGDAAGPRDTGQDQDAAERAQETAGTSGDEAGPDQDGPVPDEMTAPQSQAADARPAEEEASSVGAGGEMPAQAEAADGAGDTAGQSSAGPTSAGSPADVPDVTADATAPEPEAAAPEAPAPKRKPRSRAKTATEPKAGKAPGEPKAAKAARAPKEPGAKAEPKPRKPRAPRMTAKAKREAEAAALAAEQAAGDPAAADPAAAPQSGAVPEPGPAAEAGPATTPQAPGADAAEAPTETDWNGAADAAAPEPQAPLPAGSPDTESQPDQADTARSELDDGQPKRRGWWSFGF